MEKNQKTRYKKGKKVSGGMVKTRSQKVSEDKRINLEVAIYRNSAQDENQAGRGTEGDGIRRKMCDSTLVEQGHYFATSTGTLDREEILELSDFSIKKPAVGGSPTDITKTNGVSQKAETSSSF